MNDIVMSSRIIIARIVVSADDASIFAVGHFNGFEMAGHSSVSRIGFID